MFKHWFLFSVIVLLIASSAEAQEFQARKYDWPQWQGTNRNAISQEKGLLQSWPEGGPKLLWSVDSLGEGYSTPSVAAGRIFSMGYADGNEYVFCLKESDGSTLWKTSLGTAKRVSYNGTRCTPTVDGDQLYVLGTVGEVACLNVSDGKIVWQKNVAKEFGGRRGNWAYAESPLIDGEKMLVTPGGSKATIVALNKINGELIWKCPLPEGYSAGYSSIIKINVDGLDQYVQFLGRGNNASKGAVVGIRAKDGEFLWSYDSPGNRTANISTPIFSEDYVFAASAYGTGGALAKLTRNGEKTSAEQVYFTSDMQNHHGGMVLIGDYLYGNNSGSLACLEFKTGKVMWQSRKPGKGAIFYADDRLYYRDERIGNVYLIEASPKEYVQVGQLRQPNRSDQKAWAHPIVANGRMYIADQNHLYCYDVKAK